MLEQNDGASQGAQGDSVAKNVDETHLHGRSLGRFHACDIRDGSNVVVIKSMTEAQYPRRNKCKIQGAQLHFVYPFVGTLIVCNGGPVGDQSLDLICSRNANNLPAPTALPEMKGLHLISIGIDIFNPEAGFHVTGL